MIAKMYLIVLLAMTLSACAGVTQPIKFKETDIVSKQAYLKNKQSNGIVLLDVNWGR